MDAREARCRGFTLLELLLGMVIFSVMLLLLSVSLDAAMRLLGESKDRNERAQAARSSLGIFARQISTAVVDTKTQFVIFPGEILESRFSVDGIVANSPVAVWMSPVSGEVSQLYCIGYFLQSNPDLGRYELKRIFISPTMGEGDKPHPAYPVAGLGSGASKNDLPSPVDADWFLKHWKSSNLEEWSPANTESVIVPEGDGILAMWLQCYDQLGNPIPWVSESPVHPDSDLIYNSAAYFYAATSGSAGDEESFRYGAEHDLAMKANRLPAEVEIVIVTLDSYQIGRMKEIPTMENVLEDRRLDLEASVARFEEKLEQIGITNSETFSLRVKLVNST